MDGFNHTAGAVDGFRPNMSAEEMAELDRRRGLGDQGSFNDPDIIVSKKPWLKPDKTHKSQSEAPMHDGMDDLIRAMQIPEGGKPFGKLLPEKRSGESEFERQIRHFTEKVKENPEKYPGGHKQAIAIAAHEAGVAKKGGMPPVISSAPKPAGLGQVKPPRGVMSSSPKPTYRPPGLSPSVKGYAVGSAEDKDKEDGEFADKIFGKNVMPPPAAPAMAPPSPPAPMPAGGSMATSTMKALRSSSFYIPPPMQPYDPFGVQRSATTIPVSKAEIGENAPPVRLGDTYKSCMTHGMTYKAEQGCHPCNIQKASVCKNCGSTMMKTAGGSLSCPRGH